jgi:hypothetical protein
VVDPTMREHLSSEVDELESDIEDTVKTVPNDR